LSRLAGLIGKKEISGDYALVIPRCNMIHTFFMSTAIDVVMTGKAGRVVCLRENMKPWGVMACMKADKTIEMKPGNIKAAGIKQGDILRLEK
jgi:uncharacterized protein